MKNNKDNLGRIEKLPLVFEARRVYLKEAESSPIKFDHAQAKKNAGKIFAYRIVYKSRNHKVIGYIVEPRKGKTLPNIIWNRGGSGEITGVIKPYYLFTKIGEFAARGYITIATQYSGVEGGEGRDTFGGEDIYDVLNLYKILRGYERSDIAKIGMYGVSRGGLMTYLALARVRWLKAAVVIAAPADQVSAPKFRPGWKEHQIRMYGGSLKESKKRSPVYWTNKFSKKNTAPYNARLEGLAGKSGGLFTHGRKALQKQNSLPVGYV